MISLLWLVTACLASISAQDAAFQDSLGMHCSQSSDCGYVPALACISGKCDFCRPEGNYCSNDGSRRCQVMKTVDDVTGNLQTLFASNSIRETTAVAFCIEKDLFDPFTWKDVVATFIAFVSAALGSGCGVGGGGLLVPLYISLYGLSPKHAIPLSKATIFGNAVSAYLFNFNRKHPVNAKLPLISYQVAGIMEPMTLVGTVFGVMMNRTFPDWLILILLVSLLSYTAYKTARKGNEVHEKESKYHLALVKTVLKGGPGGGGRGRQWSIYRRFSVEIAAKRWLAKTRSNKKLREIKQESEEDFHSLPPHELQPTCREVLLDVSNKQEYGTLISDDENLKLRRKVIEQWEMRMFPLKYIAPLVLSWIVVLIQSMLRGGHGAPSIIGLTCNSAYYWVLTLLPLLVLVVITFWVGFQLRLLNRLKVLSGYRFVLGDIHWIKRRVLIFPTLCTLAGIAAGLLGIGGGMVKSPIMLEMGILPPVQSATANFMILFTSSSTTLQFAINGQFPGERQYDYIAWFALMGFMGGLCGQKVVAYLVKKYKRESIMVYLLAATIALSALAMGMIGLKSTIRDFEKGVHLGFSGICDTK
ncbi:hypothetical protein PsorP6_008753 [Peronosclerospora sorghi]|uniref:Uncharacterized protein n=1 Tax=Peronosclerospora sorghi TaxID=230839 RepID=A0ACC0VZ40_9STRA|nr:hypothetical protein PsorP6_008753 [Peronosclerospora sorghi]